MKSLSERIRLHDPFGYRWAIFGVLSIIYFLACLHRIAPTVIAQDLLREFAADATALGVMSSAYFYLYAAVQPPVGMLSDTLGPRAVTTIFALVACCGVLLFGFAPSMGVATAGRALVGIGVGGVFIPGLKIFSRWFKRNEFAAITGVFLAFGNAGNLAASLPLTYLVILLGWRASFWAIGVITLVMALCAWLVLRDKPEDKGWAAIEPDPGTVPDDALDIPADVGAVKRLKMVLGKTSFWMVTLSYFFFGGPALTFQGLWAVPYLVDVHEYSRMTAGAILMLIPLGFIIGAPVIGFLADRLPYGRKPVVVSAMGAGLACWSVFLFTGGHPPALVVAPLFLTIGLCGGGALSLYFAITKELFPAWLTGTAIGLMNPAAFLGTALFQPFTGWLMDLVGRVGPHYPVQAYFHVFIAIFASISLGFVCLMLLRIPKKQETAVQAG
ncbi:MAG: MFS transporter [Desulfobacterales bacterium]|nr:MFS transporter [Desulfobacterales bacterium]MBS3756410.1 MFS transporter [Desulfobacterales bacterium]